LNRANSPKGFAGPAYAVPEFQTTGLQGLAGQLHLFPSHHSPAADIGTFAPFAHKRAEFPMATVRERRITFTIPVSVQIDEVGDQFMKNVK
jgi:hypothetical protein